MALSSATDSLRRAWYVATMGVGARACFNRILSRSLPALRAQVLDRSRLQVDRQIELELRVHRRPAPAELGGEAAAGMLSARLVAPRIPRLLYRLLCLTSHFGCGHHELAFYERGDFVIFYGVRDIASANARRFGFGDLARRTALRSPGDEAALVAAVGAALRAAGLRAAFAEPAECVRLAVDPRLVPPSRRAPLQRRLVRRYERLGGSLRRRQALVAVRTERP